MRITRVQTNSTSNQERTSKKYHRPHCRSCGGADIDFTYTETAFGHEIDEGGALELALCYFSDIVRGEVEGDCDPEQLQRVATTMARLAVMCQVRKPADGAPAADEARP
jgi:hypothetical protein